MANILIIDDDPIFAGMLEQRLSRAGHAVSVHVGPFGSTLAARRPGLDMIILDVFMPGLDGPALLDLIRKDGAASRVKLASTIDDVVVNSSPDVDPSDGLKDRREMSATLVTTQAGSTAAGSQGVTEGSHGDPKAGEPDPVPLPANPAPQSLQYVTVYDNRDKGGFAGSKPVSAPETFRCGFIKAQGQSATEEG